MNVKNPHRWALAAIPGGICLAIGVTAVVLGELEYRGIAENVIPDLVALVTSALGAILLMISFTSVQRLQVARGEVAGRVGFWIGMAGLFLSVAWIWPLFVLGPMLIGIGVTIYAVSVLASGTMRSFGTWLHALSIPVAVLTGFAFFGAGFDGGIGLIVFMALVITGFMTLGFDAAAAPETKARTEVTL